MGHEPLLRFRGLFPSAPAWGKVCFGSWPRAQGWPCVGFGLWHLLGLLGRAVCWHWPLAVRQAIFRAAGRVSVLASGSVSDRVRQCVGFGLWPQLVPEQTCALAKNKAPNFRSLHETKELVLFIRGGHELLTFRIWGVWHFKAHIFQFTTMFICC